ncbi:hypothetical protein [Krasilnikovia sp. M28-CT-15]|uniref:hypothetical protein n=1 Tax=Krasilnikovia sp. M28-CT-15 TaxID=3373540 RepID=UPI0038771F01
MSSPKPVAIDAEALRGSLTGKRVASAQILGINSLKSLHPPLESVSDQRIVDVIVDENTRRIEIVLERNVIAADMARTGTVVILAQALAWKPADNSPMPTARIIFSDGSALDFKEPAKTKRISFTVRNIDAG